MKEMLGKEIQDRMFENFYRMKKLKASYNTMFYMSLMLLFIQLVLFIVGGLNVYMLAGAVMNFIVFAAGMKKYDSPNTLMVLTVLNFVLSAAYVVVHPVSDLLFRMGIVQHVYLAVESYMYFKLGEQKTELSYELGYPYFTELAAYEMEEKEYVPEYIPENAVSVGNADMETLREAEKTDDLYNHLNFSAEGADMDDLDTENLTFEFHSDAVKSDNNYFSSAYEKEPEIGYHGPEYDKELFAENKIRMKKYKRNQSIIFAADLVLGYICFTDALNAFFDMFKNPMEVLRFFPVFALIIASLLTVTSLDNKNNLKCGMYAFLCCGAVFSLLLLNPAYLLFFMALAGQMYVSAGLADELEYLKAQFGYPYFTEAANRKIYNKKEYTAEHKINFKNNGMDEL